MVPVRSKKEDNIGRMTIRGRGHGRILFQFLRNPIIPFQTLSQYPLVLYAVIYLPTSSPPLLIPSHPPRPLRVFSAVPLFPPGRVSCGLGQNHATNSGENPCFGVAIGYF